MDNMIINHWAVITAAVSDLFVGAIWYSPILFYKGWLSANNFTEDQVKQAANPAKTFTLTFIFALIISYNLAFFLGDANTDAGWGTAAGFLAGFGWAAMAFAIISLFEMRSWKYIFINCGYLIVAFTLKGFIIGAWR